MSVIMLFITIIIIFARVIIFDWPTWTRDYNARVATGPDRETPAKWPAVMSIFYTYTDC